MVKKTIVGLGLVGMIAFSGCSDTKESIAAEFKALDKEYVQAIKDNDKDALEECDEKRKDLKARKAALKESEK
jgi:hypothetical protein